jgi:hypothetical protein
MEPISARPSQLFRPFALEAVVDGDWSMSFTKEEPHALPAMDCTAPSY